MCSEAGQNSPPAGLPTVPGPINRRLASFCRCAILDGQLRMNIAPASLGLIAGNRSLPLEFARQARAAGVKRLVAVAVENETDPALAPLVDDIVWLKVGQLSKMIAAFTGRGVSQCVMAGPGAPQKPFRPSSRPARDGRALAA